MATSSQWLTADELFHLPSGKSRYELVRGELRCMSPAGSEHGAVTMELAMRLASHVKSHGLGVVFGAETGFQLDRNPDTVLAPDVAFVQSDRIAATGIPKTYRPGAPDLAVEVTSPADAAREVAAKTQTWLACGAREVWVVDPRQRTVTVHRSTGTPEVFAASEVLGGGDLVPGFTCCVQDLFPPASV
jgi:Uma2 family endonuclease